MRGRQRTCSVSGAGIVMSMSKTDDSPVFVLFLVVSRSIKNPRFRAPELIVI